jgi:hypothetical protein
MRLALLIVAAVQFGACATAPLTPQQEHVNRVWRRARSKLENFDETSTEAEPAN